MQRWWDPEQVVLLSGTGASRLAEEVAGLIGLPSSACVEASAVTGESSIRLGTNVRGRDVFVLQSTCDPVNSHLVELALMLTACKRASARRVTAVVPYLGYSRQTRKDKSRVPISAADVAAMLEECCVDALVTVDVHDPQIAGFYSPSCCFENLSYVPVVARYLSTLRLRSPVVVTQQATAVERAVALVDALRMSIVSASHATPTPNAGVGAGGAYGSASAASATPALAMLLPVEVRGAKEFELTGDVAGRDAILIADMVNSGTHFVRASKELILRGAARVIAFATHGLLSSEGFDRLARSEDLERVVVTNTVPTVISALPAQHNLRRKLEVSARCCDCVQLCRVSRP